MTKKVMLAGASAAALGALIIMGAAARADTVQDQIAMQRHVTCGDYQQWLHSPSQEKRDFAVAARQNCQGRSPNQMPLAPSVRDAELQASAPPAPERPFFQKIANAIVRTGWAGGVLLYIALVVFHVVSMKVAATDWNRRRCWEKRKHQYQLDEDSGQWLLKTGKAQGDRVWLRIASESSRRAEEQAGVVQILQIAMPAYLLGVPALWLWLFGVASGNWPGWQVWTCAIVALLFIAPFMLIQWSYNSGRIMHLNKQWVGLIIEPPTTDTPLEEIHGPTVHGNAPATPQAPAVDLTYRPNQ